MAELSFSALQARVQDRLIRDSYVEHGKSAFVLAHGGASRWLYVFRANRDQADAGDVFEGGQFDLGDGILAQRCPVTATNMAMLRNALPWLRPVPLGTLTSAGMGDRLGLATPGHVDALKRAIAAHPGKILAPIFAQQSIREMVRTNRTAIDVITDATWGCFEAGWRGPVGADADHLKTTDDIDVCAAAGFSFFTIDPSAFVNAGAAQMDEATLDRELAMLPWSDLETSSADALRAYSNRVVDLDSRSLTIEPLAIKRAAVKYGRCVAHVLKMARHLRTKDIPFDLEVSVDETESPTTPEEHIYVARELARLGVKLVSLAPRFIGAFEKGVDFIGDLGELKSSLNLHAQIARACGGYKLSLHSGSDKFSVYPLIAEATRGLVHLKTAGTSYLEALRVIARLEPALFRQIAELGRERYETDRATYHVSGLLAAIPEIKSLADDQLPGLLDENNARQILHVTFGSALAAHGKEIYGALRLHARAYRDTVSAHFLKHLMPFAEYS